MPVFIQNKYTNWYYSIIENAKTRVLSEGTYTESHHIIPESFFKERKRKGLTGWLDGNPDSLDNLVNLTAREHYTCHWLLIKMTNGAGLVKMLSAFSFILGKKDGVSYITSSRAYETVKHQVSDNMCGDKNHMYGKRGKLSPFYGKPRPAHVITALRRKGRKLKPLNAAQKAARSARLSKTVKKIWETRDRKKMSDLMKARWDNYSDDKKERERERLRNLCNTMTPEQKAEAKRKRTESVAKQTPEQKAEIERKRKETNASKTPEEVAESERKRKETNAAKSQDEVEASAKKRKDALTNRTEEQVAATERKRKETTDNWALITCPHCGMVSKSVANMKTYHFDNCLKHPNPKPRKLMKRTACVHCGEMVTNNIMAISHDDKCKHKPKE
jgi:hypothetical protein